MPIVSAAACAVALAAAVAFETPAQPAAAIAEPDDVSAARRREHALDAYYRGNPEQALAEYLAIIEQDPADHHAREQSIWILRELGRHEEALWHIGRLAEHESPGEAAALYTVVAALSRDIDAAREAYTAREAAAAGPEEQFHAGLAEFLDNDYEAATELLEAARSHRSLQPHAEWLLARIAAERGEHEHAAKLLQKARREEPNLTAALIPLAESLLALGETERAHEVLNRAELSIPWNKTASELNARLVGDHPELLAARVERRERRIAGLEPEPVSVIAPERDTIPALRVGLAENLQRIDLKAGGAFVLVSHGGELLARGEAGTVLRVAHRSEGGRTTGSGHPQAAITLEDNGLLTLIESTEPVRLEYLSPEHTTAVFDFAFGGGQYSAGYEDRRYRGSMEVFPSTDGGLTLVNEVNIEEYLYSVVPSEMPASWPAGALQAQAAAARSYTLAGAGRFASRGFDLYGSVRSAFYRGVDGEHPHAVAAVQATQGQVLMTGDRPLNAVYSANAGGHTEDSEVVWGSSSSLVGVPDPQVLRWMRDKLESRGGPAAGDRHGTPLAGEAWLPPAALQQWIRTRPESFSGDTRFAAYHAYRWRLLVSRTEIEERLEAHGQEVGTLQAVIPRGRGAGGRVQSVELRGSETRRVLTGDTIRHRLGGLRSTLFVVDPVYNSAGEVEFFWFTGGGWGHGVGMCQTGAAAMGELGYPYQAILAHYYPQAELRQMYRREAP